MISPLFTNSCLLKLLVLQKQRFFQVPSTHGQRLKHLCSFYQKEDYCILGNSSFSGWGGVEVVTSVTV